MLIGILSDSHGRAGAAKAAVELLRGRGAEFLIHCGDVGSNEVLDALAGVPAGFVFGNTDYGWERQALQRYADLLGVRYLGPVGELELAGKQFAVMHGDDGGAYRRVLAEQRHDYLLHGHTHVRRDERVGRIHVINPGALHRAREKTVALLDTAADAVAFLVVAGDAR